MKGELTTGFGGNSITLRDGASALFRRRALVLFTFLAVVLGTAVVTYLLPNKYESRMKILVKNQRVDVAITPQATGGAPLWVESEVSENQINSEIELLTSRDLLAQAAKDCGLAQAGTPPLWKKPIPEPERLEKAAADLAKDLVITPVKKANVISFREFSGSCRRGPEEGRRALSGKTLNASSSDGRVGLLQRESRSIRSAVAGFGKAANQFSAG